MKKLDGLDEEGDEPKPIRRRPAIRRDAHAAGQAKLPADTARIEATIKKWTTPSTTRVSMKKSGTTSQQVQRAPVPKVSRTGVKTDGGETPKKKSATPVATTKTGRLVLSPLTMNQVQATSTNQLHEDFGRMAVSGDKQTVVKGKLSLKTNTSDLSQAESSLEEESAGPSGSTKPPSGVSPLLSKYLLLEERASSSRAIANYATESEEAVFQGVVVDPPVEQSAFYMISEALKTWITPKAASLVVGWQAHFNESREPTLLPEDVPRSPLMDKMDPHFFSVFQELGHSLEQRRRAEDRLAHFVHRLDYAPPMVEFDDNMWKATTCVLVDIVTAGGRSGDVIVPDMVESLGMTQVEYLCLTTRFVPWLRDSLSDDE